MRPFWLTTTLALLASAAQATPLTYDAALKLAGQSAPSLQGKALDVRAAQSAAIAALRARLVPELPVYALEERDGEDHATAGIVDAMAYDESGRPEVVVDWKSDVAPTESAVEGYRGQVRRYMAATGAGIGLIVFATDGRVVSVAPPAGALAGALNAKRMLLLTDVVGVLDAKGELIREMSVDEARQAIADGVAKGGMIPKLETAIAAVESGVEAVVIMDGRRPHAMLVELFTEHGAGTLISRER